MGEKRNAYTVFCGKARWKEKDIEVGGRIIL
jgi:hypothetical protein